MKLNINRIVVLGLVLLGLQPLNAADNTNTTPAFTNAPTLTNNPAWLTAPLSLVEAVDIALRQNSAILRGRSDIEAAYGIILQTRAIAIPKVRGNSAYTYNEAVETFTFDVPPNLNQGTTVEGINPGQSSWNGTIQVVQSIYEGGRITSAFRTAKLTRQQALLQFDTVVADTVLDVRTAYYDVLLAKQQILVQEASLELLRKELQDTTRRFEAGTVPRFNVLRAEVEVANAQPKLINARNNFQIAKNRLVNRLGYHIPANVMEDIPLQLTDKLDAPPFQIDLSAAVAQALQNRPELGVLRKTEGLRQEDIINAKAGYKPSLEVFGGYTARSPQLRDDFFQDVSGWIAGVQLNWSIFDGNATRGRVKEAQARLQTARVDLDDGIRRIELEVRTDYSLFVEARDVLESQKKVQEQAEEALRLARARYEAGTGTQLDVLDAQTSLTQARSTQARALRDYQVAVARLERAIGLGFKKPSKQP